MDTQLDRIIARLNEESPADNEKSLHSYYENSTRKGGCINEARKLRREEQLLGDVYWVKSVGHAYYIPYRSNDNDPGLNQLDNGYEGYPKITTREVRENGDVISTNHQYRMVLRKLLRKNLSKPL